MARRVTLEREAIGYVINAIKREAERSAPIAARSGGADAAAADADAALVAHRMRRTSPSSPSCSSHTQLPNRSTTF